MTGATADVDQHLDGLTELQRKFVEEMLLDPTSATRAYIKAGGRGAEGSSARQQAARLMADDGVARALDAARRERSARMRIDAAWVTERLVMLINRCMTVEEVYDSQGERTGVFKFDAGGASTALRTLVLHLEKNPPPRASKEEYERAKERLEMMGYELPRMPTTEECELARRLGIDNREARRLLEAAEIRARVRAKGLDPDDPTPAANCGGPA
jgi:phage terminase small subunit